MYRKILHLYIVMCCLAFAGSEQYTHNTTEQEELLAYAVSDTKPIAPDNITVKMAPQDTVQPKRESAADLVALGAILCSDGDTAFGITLINEGIALQEKTDFYLLRAEIHRDLKRYHEALDDCDKAISLDQTSEKSMLLKGELLQLLTQPEEAIEAYNLLLSLKPMHPQAMFQRAKLHEQMGNNEQAIEDISTLIAENPHQVDGYFFRAKLLRKLQQFEYAISDYRSIYKIDSSYFDVTYEIAMTFGENHQLDSMRYYMNIFIEKSLGSEAFNMIMHKQDETAFMLK